MGCDILDRLFIIKFVVILYFRSMFIRLRFQVLLSVLLLSLSMSSCKKYEEELIPNNVAPPDNTISEVTMQTYVNKVYISVLGRKPTDLELDQGLEIINQGNLSVSSRLAFLDQVQAKSEYYPHLYSLARQELLNDLDTAEISGNKALFEFLLSQPEYAAYAAQLTKEIVRLDSMMKIPSNLEMDQPFGVAKMHKWCINNYFYDQLNMGTYNFVTSSFEHFLFRDPSDSELFGGSKMVDGFSGTLFFQVGSSKMDYLNIFFFQSSDYYQGQVRDLYQRYLFRDPSSEETVQLAVPYKSTGDFKELQKQILALDEYVGLK